MKRQKQNNKNKFDAFIKYSSLGFEMMTIIALGTFLGYKIDQWMENEFKGFTFGLMVFSVILSILYALRNLLKK
jgi:F0F1-type ATP synthase assembly protein I